VAKKKKEDAPRTLDQSPFPTLKRSRGGWSGTFDSPAWQSFVGAEDGQKLTLDVEAEDGEPPSPEQVAAFQYLLEHDQALVDLALAAIDAERPWLESANFEEVGAVAEVRDRLGLPSVYIHRTAREGAAYVGLEFACEWDLEHGLGILLHRDRVVGVGAMDMAYPGCWEAEEDAPEADDSEDAEEDPDP
jgi:hypothetical protein